MGELINFPMNDPWLTPKIDPRITAKMTEVHTSVLNDPRLSYGAKGLFALIAMRADADLHMDPTGIPGWGTPEVEGYRAELRRYTGGNQ